MGIDREEHRQGGAENNKNRTRVTKGAKKIN